MTVRELPYSALAFVKHRFNTDHLTLYVIFRMPMKILTYPPVGKWECKVDTVIKAVSASAWLDAWTLALTVPSIASEPAAVTLAFEGPDTTLKTSWEKQWEPWGAIPSVPYDLGSGVLTVTAGPDPIDDLNVTNVSVIFLDTTDNAITIGGLVSGVNGQVMHIAKITDDSNAATLEHNEGTANQNLMLHAGGDESLSGQYGGWALACDGLNWYDMSHSKHV